VLPTDDIAVRDDALKLHVTDAFACDLGKLTSVWITVMTFADIDLGLELTYALSLPVEHT